MTISAFLIITCATAEDEIGHFSRHYAQSFPCHAEWHKEQRCRFSTQSMQQSILVNYIYIVRYSSNISLPERLWHYTHTITYTRLSTLLCRFLLHSLMQHHIAMAIGIPTNVRMRKTMDVLLWHSEAVGKKVIHVHIILCYIAGYTFDHFYIFTLPRRTSQVNRQY